MNRANALLRYGIPAIVFVGLVFFLAAGDDGGQQKTTQQKTEQRKEAYLTGAQMDALNVEAESPEDTVSTLIVEFHQMQKKLDQTQQKAHRLVEQNKRLVTAKQNMDRAINQALAEQQRHFQASRESLLNNLTQRLENLRVTFEMNTQSKASDANQSQPPQKPQFPIGLGLRKNPSFNNTFVWVGPLGGPTPASITTKATANSGVQSGKSAFATDFAVENRTGSSTSITHQSLRPASTSKRKITPVYTVPKNSTLVGSVAMTALLGRVPRSGSVQNPYPFKVVIGAENLITNGITLPEIKGAVVSCKAVGDWTLSCVRGIVRSITFVFQDGTVRTVPDPPPVKKNRRKKDPNGIGYLSNPQGLPCIPGARKTNALQFITNQMLLSAGAAAANAVALGQTTTGVSGFGAVRGVTGDYGKYIAGRAVSRGVQSARNWIKERFGQTFDAVYVPPGQPVVVNVTEPLPIDYEHKGRQVHHAYSTRRTNSLD